MSTKAVAIWLVVAVLLGSAAIYLLTRSGGPGGAGANQGRAVAGARLLDFLPTDLVSIEVKAPNRPSETIRRAAGNAEWVIVLPAAPAAATPGVPVPPPGEGRAWPLLDTRLQSFLTLLAETRIIGPPAADADVGTSPTLLRLTLSSGRIAELALAERTIGGTGLVRVTVTNPADPRDVLPKPLLAVVDDRLHQVLRSPGPRAWRDQTALRLTRGNVSRIALESGGRELELGRVDGRWSLRKPMAAPANGPAVDRLLRTLSQVPIVDFLDAGPGTAATGLSQPAARVRLEQDQRTLDDPQTPRTVTLSNELVVGSVGGLGAAGADRLFARIDADRIVLIDGKSLADLQIDPGSYVWPHPSVAAPADIGTILMEVRSADGGSIDDASAAPRILRREIERWSAVAADGSTVPMLDTQLADVNRLIAFITGVTGNGAEAGPGAAHIAAQPPGRFVPFGRIALLSIGSAQLEQIEIGEAGRGLVSFRTGDVFRTYPEDRLPRLIAELRARAKAAGVPIEGFGATGPEAREPVK